MRRLIALFLLSVPCFAAPALVRHTEQACGGGSASYTEAFAANTAGSAIVVAVAWQTQTITVTGVTDTKGNTYTAAGAPLNWFGTTYRMQVWIALNVAATATTNTVTMAFSSSSATICAAIAEFSGIATSSALDGYAAAIGTAATASSGTITSANATNLIFGFGMDGNAVSGAGSGFTFIATPASFSSNATEYKVATTTSNTATLTGASNWGVIGLGLQPPGAASTPATIPKVIVWQ